jgi:hypothetical protein
MRGQSGGEDFELLGQGRIRIEGVPRLSLAHHVDHFDAGKDGGGGGRRFEAEHRPDPALDAPMVLLDPIVCALRKSWTAIPLIPGQRWSAPPD